MNIDSAVFCDMTRYKYTRRHTKENYHISETAVRAKVKSVQQREIKGTYKTRFPINSTLFIGYKMEILSIKLLIISRINHKT